MTGEGEARDSAGESKHADLGVSLPGPDEVLSAPDVVGGKKGTTPNGAGIAEEFKGMVAGYIEGKWGAAGVGRGRSTRR